MAHKINALEKVYYLYETILNKVCKIFVWKAIRSLTTWDIEVG